MVMHFVKIIPCTHACNSKLLCSSIIIIIRTRYIYVHAVTYVYNYVIDLVLRKRALKQHWVLLLNRIEQSFGFKMIPESNTLHFRYF